MTVLALIVAAVALSLVVVERRQRRRRDRWEAERERIERYHERIAARNGHPLGNVIAVAPVNGYDHPEPDELP